VKLPDLNPNPTLNITLIIMLIPNTNPNPNPHLADTFAAIILHTNPRVKQVHIYFKICLSCRQRSHMGTFFIRTPQCAI